MRALSGAVVTPPACGATFVPTEALPRSAPGGDPARALSRAFADARLDFAFVPSWEPWARELTAALRGADAAVLWAVPGVFSPALRSLGHSNGLRTLGRDPGALVPALDEAEAAMMRAVADGISERADVIVVADDLGGSAGPTASPAYLAEHVMPRLARAVAAARATRLRSVLHSDGDVSLLLADIVRAGFGAVHLAGIGDDVFARILGEARSRKLVVLGGLGAQALSQGVAGGVRAGTRLATLARSGPLLVADDGGITTPKEYSALLAAYSAVRGRL